MSTTSGVGSALQGRVAVVTGGGSGIGRAIVERFLTEGASVVVLEVSDERAEVLRSDHQSDRLRVVQGDARVLTDNRHAVECSVSTFGHLDAFVANTGYWDFGLSLDDLPEDGIDAGFQEIFDLNVKSYLMGAKASVDQLRARSGSLIFTASNAALHPGGGGPLYTASKHAVVGLVRQLAYELAPDVRVNAVAPGAMSTALTGPSSLGLPVSGIDELPMDALISEVSPLGFLPKASDYTGWYVVLASGTDARTMTGAVIECDGGERVRGRAFSEYARSNAGDPRAQPVATKPARLDS